MTRHLSFSRAMHWLARDIAHLKVGVALGSGGARGFAHVGAFRFLEEHDIPNDYLAGSSMGSVIGAPRALGMDQSGSIDVDGAGGRYGNRATGHNRALRSILSGSAARMAAAAGSMAPA